MHYTFYYHQPPPKHPLSIYMLFTNFIWSISRCKHNIPGGATKWNYFDETTHSPTRSPSFSNVRNGPTWSKFWNVSVLSWEYLEGVQKVCGWCLVSGRHINRFTGLVRSEQIWTVLDRSSKDRTHQGRSCWIRTGELWSVQVSSFVTEIFEPNTFYCHTRLHFGFSAKLRIWQVPACFVLACPPH